MTDEPRVIKEMIKIEKSAQKLVDHLLKLCSEPENFENESDRLASQKDLKAAIKHLKAASKLSSRMLADLDQQPKKYGKAGG